VSGVRPERPVEIRVYDRRWSRRFEYLAAGVLAHLSVDGLRAEHVGSTAVPGLAAKPIIDLDVVGATAGRLRGVIRGLAALGYEHQGDLGIRGREAFRARSGEPEHHLYVVLEGADELTRHLAFRDALRADTLLRDRYADLKRALAARHRYDRNAYTDAKSVFIEAVLQAAGPSPAA
jgi:GrpB-like predicted nucleotidyltransferase (UPF0157 family)